MTALKPLRARPASWWTRVHPVSLVVGGCCIGGAVGLLLNVFLSWVMR